MPVIPREPYRIFPNPFRSGWLGGGFEHRQRPRGQLRGLAWLAARFVAFLVAQCAWAGVPKKRKRVAGTVAVLPLDFHAGTRADVHFDRFWVIGERWRGIYVRHGFSIACDNWKGFLTTEDTESHRNLRPAKRR